MKERRFRLDRRSNNLTQERSVFCNRRRFPDRRLNNISAEWIPMTLLRTHPVSEYVLRLTRRAVTITKTRAQ
jgi:hypothetical protein